MVHVAKTAWPIVTLAGNRRSRTVTGVVRRISNRAAKGSGSNLAYASPNGARTDGATPNSGSAPRREQ
jgi:hypothetical protein